MNPWAGEIARGAFMTPGPQGSPHRSTRTETNLWSHHPQETGFEMVYDLEPTQSRNDWSPTSRPSSSLKSSSSNSFESFAFDKAMFGNAVHEAGDDPRLYWGTPHPLPDQPPTRNPRMRGYRGPTTSRLIAGAGPGMEGLEEINEGWVGPQQPPLLTMEEQVNQLMQQVVNLQGENAQLCNEVQDLRQGN